MSQLKARCIEQVLTFENTPVITSGDVNYDSITFDFCSAWDGFTKTAIFYRSENEVYYQLLDEANTCIIPREVLETKGTIYIGVFGVRDDITLTSQVLKYRIAQGAITDNLKPADPTPDIYAQIISRYNHYDERLSYFEERFNGSAGDAEFLEGHDAEYFATAESVEKLTTGETPAGKATEADDASKLGGKSPDHFATAESVTDIIEGTTPVGKAEDSSKLDGHNANEFFPKTGGYITGEEAGIGDRNSESGVTWGLKNSKRFITEQILPDGTYRIRDTNNDKAIIKSNVDGTTTFEGTASGNLPKTGGQIDSASYEPIKINSTLETAGAVYIAFKICGTNMGQLGVTKYGEPIFYATDGSGGKKLLHDGNSAKVHIGDTAPNDTTGNVLFINTSS